MAKRTEENLVRVAEDQIAPQIIEAIRADERLYWAIQAEQMAMNFRDPEGSQGSAHHPEVREKLASMCDWFVENLRSPSSRN